MYRNGWVTGEALAWAALTALRAGTYGTWPDGDWRAYGAAGLLWSVAAPLTWLAVRLSAGRRSALPWIAALGVLLPFDATHYVRLTQQRWTPVITLEAPSSAGAAPVRALEWEPAVQPGATVTVEGQRVTIENPIGVAGYAELKMPAPVSSAWDELWLPRGILGREFAERIEWDGTIERWGSFQVLLNTRRVTLQATSFGLTVTYPNERGATTTFDINTPAVHDSTPHRFLLERADGVIRLRLDDLGVWVRPDTGPLGFIRFGEGSADPTHGGRHVLQAVRYVRQYVTGND